MASESSQHTRPALYVAHEILRDPVANFFSNRCLGRQGLPSSQLSSYRASFQIPECMQPFPSSGLCRCCSLCKSLHALDGWAVLLPGLHR